MSFRGQDEALAWLPWQGGLGRAREQHPSCLLHSYPHVPSSATIPPSPLPGALGPYPGAQGKDRAAGTPGSPPSPGVGYSVTSDWGMARTELLWRGRRAEPLCLGTLLLVPMEGPVCGPGLCPLPHTTAPLAASTLTCVPSHRGRKQGTQPGHTAWVPDVCARCVCPRMHTHTALSHTQCTPLQC